MIKKYKENIIKKILEDGHKKYNNDLEQTVKVTLKEAEQLIKDFKNKKPIISNKKDSYKFFKLVKDKEMYAKKLLSFIKTFYKDSKRLYIITIFLDNGKIKCLKLYENPNIEGFTYGLNYYNIDSVCVINQYEDSILFYKEGKPAPINFLKSSYVNDAFELTLSGENLKNIVDGKAFKGIVSLGKEDKGFFGAIDWKMAVIGLAILLATYLQMTGQIDLVSMFALT